MEFAPIKMSEVMYNPESCTGIIWLIDSILFDGAAKEETYRRENHLY